MTDSYRTLAKLSTGLLKDRGSKFYAYAQRVDSVADAETFLGSVKADHPKARHHCFAYRIGLSGDVFRENDDGEPSGSAGKPIMGQIQSFGLTNVMVIVVRYFGGKLLGASGLIKAYKGAAADALEQSVIIEDTVKSYFTVTSSFGALHEVLPLLKQDGVVLLSEDYSVEPIFTLGVRMSEASALRDKLEAIDGVSTATKRI